jgi:hypothetical protein
MNEEEDKTKKGEENIRDKHKEKRKSKIREGI